MTPVVLDMDAAPEVVDVLCEAFYDYPVMRWVLGSPSDYPARLHELMTVYVMARVLRDEVMIGVPGPTALLAAATVSYPGQRESPPELGELRERLSASLVSFGIRNCLVRFLVVCLRFSDCLVGILCVFAFYLFGSLWPVSGVLKNA